VLHQLDRRCRKAAIIGIPSEQWGEDRAWPIVAVKPGHTLTAGGDPRALRANLARFKCPRLVEFVERCRATPPARSTSRRCATVHASKPTDASAAAS
jgi:fatty-acyl-CoA synthase